jgi:hypothetical protein
VVKIVEGEYIDSQAWAELVRCSPVATWFQTQEAYNFYCGLSFLDAFAYAVEEEGQLKGIVVGYIQRDGGKLKRFFSRRAVILGGPLLQDGITGDEFGSLLDALKKGIEKKVIFLEIRNFHDYSTFQPIYSRYGYVYEPHYDVQVNTTSMEMVIGKLDRNRKRNIKKALENGIVLDESPTADDMKQYYMMLERLYATKVKTPLFPFEFFEKLRLCPSSLFIMAKNTTGQLLGGLVCVVSKNRSVYAWMACADDANNKTLFPSVMVNYAGICYAVDHGIPRFDFMGAGKPDDGGYGVRDFKLKFGGELLELGRYSYIYNPFLYNLGKLAVRILKKL